MTPPPRFLFMEVNKRCNLRCTHCDFWQRDDDDRSGYLPRERKRQVIDEFAALSPDGSLVICGGEPMLDLEEYFAMCADARAAGLRVLSVVNGTCIRTPALAERMVLSGPHEISISLDAPDEAENDRARGVQGAYRLATGAVRLLVAARDAHPQAGAKIIVMGLVYASNFRRIPAFYDLVLDELRADKLKLNFLQPSFGQSGKLDPWFAAESGVDADELVALIRAADATHGLGLNPEWLRKVGTYFRSVAAAHDRERGWRSSCGKSEQLCNIYDRNIMVNHHGMARLCFSKEFRGEPLVRPGDLTRFWKGAGDIRRQMRACRAFCGISHSVREQSSTLAGVAKGAEFAARARARATPLQRLRAALLG